VSSKQNVGRDPDKRAAKRARQREALARGAMPTTAKTGRVSQSQMTHASGSKARKKRREGEKRDDGPHPKASDG
jgi:hypothetical protein